MAAGRALSEADTLPGPLDYEVAIPPVSRAWCRRVTGANLWLFFGFDDQVVTLMFVTAQPPLPLDRT